jgi:hypothetical protein
MHFTKTLRASALAASLAVALGMAFTPTPAAADTATGNTAFKVILQPVTLLYYYNEVDLTIPSSVLTTLAGGAPAGLTAAAVTASGTSSTLSASLTSPAPSAAPGSIGSAALTLSNFWAVRSITSPGSGGLTTVTVSFASATAAPTATLTGTTTTTATIGLSALATTNSSFAGTGLGGTPQTGNVTMNMNLSNATTADTYQGATIYISATST